jgi:acyl carrier protein
VNEELKRILIDELGLDEAAVRPENSLAQAGLDSLSVVELSVGLAEHLDLEISEDDLQRAATVGELDRLVEQRRDADRAHP